MSSLEKQAAYAEIKPKLPNIRTRIYNYLKEHGGLIGLTVDHLSIALNVKSNTVTGRLDELMDAGVITGTKDVKMNCTFYKVSLDESIEYNRKLRAAQKMEIWMQKGIKRYSSVISGEFVEEMKIAVKNAYKNAASCRPQL